jgi:3-methylcrotonyl-CoA carboxylase alpha subunit
VELVSSQGYVGLATVEFIVDEAGIPYFLEVNPRLQVEHGITELVFGIDLVELQLRATAGDAMDLPAELSARGSAIEVRLYAEDPERGFMPQPGLLEEFSFPPSDASFRVDTGFRQGDSITPHYDPLLAKVMAHGPTRQDAIERLLAGLHATRLALRGKTGPKRSNLALMQRVLQSPVFRSGQYNTHLLEELP